ncbi:MbcA/ParS/Xre antitoxin family protein [Stenotrophomonas maltophilia]|uniref:MbcA/ParS/Xre antitoxin family protein n=1 Tax=Stenotrophomonas maltophilia TaxID=40324 RepID=UPI003BF7AC12
MSQSFVRNAPSLAGPALLAFTQVATAWSLTRVEQSAILGQPVEAAFAVLKTGVVDDLWPETLERVSYLIGIYRALRTIFPNQQQADSWVRRPNTAAPFRGTNALALMCSGRLGGLATVRQYLEAEVVVEP